MTCSASGDKKINFMLTYCSSVNSNQCCRYVCFRKLKNLFLKTDPDKHSFSGKSRYDFYEEAFFNIYNLVCLSVVTSLAFYFLYRDMVTVCFFQFF